MTRCLGTTISEGQRRVCQHAIYQCNNCGNIGCDQHSFSQCSNQGYVYSRCLVCSAKGQNEYLESNQ